MESRARSKEVLFVLLPDFAEHEVAYLAEALSSDEYALKTNPKYVTRFVAADGGPVRSIGGMKVLPDYRLDTMPDDYAALVLVGGFGWGTPIADKVVPVVSQAVGDGKIVGAICNAVSFMARHGLLNDVRHTGNGVDQLVLWGGDSYYNAGGYVHEQAVTDRNVITANGSAALEFARELLMALGNDTPERVEMFYGFHKHGFCTLFPKA